MGIENAIEVADNRIYLVHEPERKRRKKHKQRTRDSNQLSVDALPFTAAFNRVEPVSTHRSNKALDPCSVKYPNLIGSLSELT